MKTPKKKTPRPDQAFRDYVVDDLLASFDGISARPMFGGWGIYQHGVIFAIIADGELFFKVDDTSRPEYERRGSRPFTYEAANQKSVSLSYWLLPAEAMEDSELLEQFVATAVKVGRNSASKSRPKNEKP